MKIIFSVIRSITNLISGLSAIYFFAFLYLMVKKKFTLSDFSKKVKETTGRYPNVAIVVLTVSIIFSILLNGSVQQAIGFHNLLLEDEGKCTYYVELDGELLPAQIEVVTDRETYGDYDEKTKVYYYYYLNKVCFPNDVVVSFYNNEPLQINEYVEVYDENEKYWSCKLLNQHAYSSKLEETNDIHALNIIFLTIQVLSMGTCLFCTYKKDHENPDK